MGIDCYPVVIAIWRAGRGLGIDDFHVTVSHKPQPMTFLFIKSLEDVKWTAIVLYGANNGKKHIIVRYEWSKI